MFVGEKNLGWRSATAEAISLTPVVESNNFNSGIMRSCSQFNFVKSSYEIRMLIRKNSIKCDWNQNASFQTIMFHILWSLQRISRYKRYRWPHLYRLYLEILCIIGLLLPGRTERYTVAQFMSLGSAGSLPLPSTISPPLAQLRDLLSEQGKHAWYARLCQDGFVVLVVMSYNAHDISETTRAESI